MLLEAIVVFVGGWLAPDIVALVAAGLLITLLGMFALSVLALQSVMSYF